MRIIKVLSVLGMLLGASTLAHAQGQLPLSVTEPMLGDQSIFTNVDQLSWEDGQVRSGDGWGAGTIYIEGTPGILSFDYSRNKYGKSQKLTFQESPDNSAWTDVLVTSPTTDWNHFEQVLKPDTRYVRFSYTADYKFGDVWFKYAYIKNIQITKAMQPNSSELNITAEEGQSESRTIAVKAYNITGNLDIESPHPDITVSPNTFSQQDITSTDSIRFTVTYTPTMATTGTGNLLLKDSGHATNTEPISITGRMNPKTPELQEESNISATSFTINWIAREGFEYQVELMDAAGAPVDESIQTEYLEGSCQVQNLQPNTLYTYRVSEKNGPLVSQPTESRQVQTTQPAINITDTLDIFITSPGIASTQTIGIEGESLQSDICLALNDGTCFSISQDTISHSQTHTDLTVTFSPATTGKYQDTLTLTSEHAEPVVITLSGICHPDAPVALEAEEITSSSFIARWQAVEGADDYYLTVTDEQGLVEELYEKISTGDTTAYRVINLQPSKGYQYYLSTVSNGVESEDISNTISVTTTEGAVITYYPNLQPFATEAGTTFQQSIRLRGDNILGDIHAAVSGDEAFSIDQTNVSPNNGIVTISYSPTKTGSNHAELILKATGANDLTIALTGYAMPQQVTLLEATSVQTNEFQANWQTVGDATAYLLTVYEADKALENYNKLNVGNVSSYRVENLKSNQTYSYQVTAVAEDIESAVSEQQTVTTRFIPEPYADQLATEELIIAWKAPQKADKYLVSLKKGETYIDAYVDQETTETWYKFGQLDPATTYTFEVKAVFGEYVTAAGTGEGSTAGQSTLFGQQIGNSDFEAWEGSGNTREPVNWNSFGTGTGDLIGTAVSMTGIRLEESTETRPGSTGSKSARIWTGESFSIKANGNLTLGQINAGSMTPSDPKNYNFSKTDSEEFSERLNARPDTLSVWVKYTNSNPEDKARVSAIIHDTYNYRDPSGSDPESPNHELARAELNFESKEGAWQRLSIPFVYNGAALSPEYILVSFTPHMTPGGGSKDDALWIDDLQLIYTPSLTIGQLEKTDFRPGELITVTYDIDGSMSVWGTNTTTLELSDANGSFAEPVVLNSIVSDKSGKLSANLPETLPAGNGYKVRIVTTHYPMSAESEAFAVSETTPTPVIEISGESETEAYVGRTVTMELSVKTQEIETPLFVYSNSESFEATPNILPANGGVITITYRPKSVGTETGTITVKATENIMATHQITATVTMPTGIKPATGAYADELTVSPNPVVDVAKVTGADSNAGYCLYNTNGILIEKGRLTDGLLNTASLKPGVYFLSIGHQTVKLMK